MLKPAESINGIFDNCRNVRNCLSVCQCVERGSASETLHQGEGHIICKEKTTLGSKHSKHHTKYISKWITILPYTLSVIFNYLLPHEIMLEQKLDYEQNSQSIPM